MNPRSLAWRTDLIFPRFDCEILDRGRYLVIRTPSNPTFYWGNFLLFDRPPAPGDDERWPRLFAEEIGAPPRVRHQAFGWDSPEGHPPPPPRAGGAPPPPPPAPPPRAGRGPAGGRPGPAPRFRAPPLPPPPRPA